MKKGDLDDDFMDAMIGLIKGPVTELLRARVAKIEKKAKGTEHQHHSHPGGGRGHHHGQHRGYGRGRGNSRWRELTCWIYLEKIKKY